MNDRVVKFSIKETGLGSALPGSLLNDLVDKLVLQCVGAFKNRGKLLAQIILTMPEKFTELSLTLITNELSSEVTSALIERRV